MSHPTAFFVKGSSPCHLLLIWKIEPQNGSFNRDFEHFSTLVSKVPNFNWLWEIVYAKIQLFIWLEPPIMMSRLHWDHKIDFLKNNIGTFLTTVQWDKNTLDVTFENDSAPMWKASRMMA